MIHGDGQFNPEYIPLLLKILTKNYNKSSTYLSEKKTLKLKEVEYRNLSNLTSKIADEIILTLSLVK